LFPIIKERKERVSMIQRTRSGNTIHVIGNPVLDSEGNIEIIIFTSRDLTEIRHLRDKIERTEHLLESFQEELEELRRFQNRDQEDLISFSPNMRKIVKMVEKIAKVDSTVLVTGKSGVGKGVIVSTIHKKSYRNGKPFIHVNCGAIPESLIESELFGYEQGAFTGAKKEGKKGLFEEAHEGTLFLDEIGEMPLNLQVKLLKALQENVIQRVGGTKSIEIDVRIIAATNKDLENMVEEGTFREDLFYRLNVIPIYIPPLRTRQEDISYLMDYFLNKFNHKYHSSTVLSLEAENALINYDWPGNVRELENLMERLVVVADNNEIQLKDLPQKISNYGRDQSQYFVHLYDICTLKQAQEDVEEQLIKKAYEKYKSSYKVGEALGINQSTAFRKIQKYIKNEGIK
jgi:transcriptional regulator with PAS, ATPase and Fis domain